jgi:hypothetical protein
MAEVLSTLAAFTKTTKERQFSGFLLFIYLFITYCATENLLRGFVRRTDLEAPSQRQLDDLTKEERLISATKNLDTTHNDNIGAATAKLPTRDIADHEKVNTSHYGSEHHINGKETATESRTCISLSFSMQLLTLYSGLALK